MVMIAMLTGGRTFPTKADVSDPARRQRSMILRPNNASDRGRMNSHQEPTFDDAYKRHWRLACSLE
jgi:hypothetical protein